MFSRTKLLLGFLTLSNAYLESCFNCILRQAVSNDEYYCFDSQSSSRMTMCCSNTDPDISNSQCGATGFICYNDDSTGDAQGRTCSQYFDYNACTNGIRGFQTDTFNPNDQCCSCSLTAGTKVTMRSSRMTCSQKNGWTGDNQLD